jgi:hypothetical protein
MSETLLLLIFFFLTLSEQPDQEVGVLGGQIKPENSFPDERLRGPAGVLPQVVGHPFDRASQVFSFRQ